MTRKLYCKQYYQVHKEKLKAYMRTYAKTLFTQMIETYGGKCKCCGITEITFLSLEHVNKDGAKHRREKGCGLGTYLDLRKRGFPKDGYTVLCMNCNHAIGRIGYCPHELQRFLDQSKT